MRAQAVRTELKRHHTRVQGCPTRIWERSKYPLAKDRATSVKNRQLDATLQSAGLGVSSIRDLTILGKNHRRVEVPATTVDKVRLPYVKAGPSSTNTYTGQTTAIETAAVVNYLTAQRSTRKDDLVYAMTKNELAIPIAQARRSRWRGRWRGCDWLHPWPDQRCC